MKQRGNNGYSKLEQLKGESSSTRQTKPLEASELEAEVPKRPLFSPLEERFEIHVANARRPPTPVEKADFDKFKFDIARAFDEQKYGYSLGDGKEFTPTNLGKLLDHEMQAKTVTRADGVQVVTKQDYVRYFEDLRVFTKNDDTITQAKTALTKLESLQEAPNKAQIMEDVTKAIKQLDKQKLLEFKQESEAAVDSLQRVNLKSKLKKPLTEYFKVPAIDTQKFAAARAIQVNPEKSLDLAKPIFSTAEEVMYTLPAELDLTTELYRYSLIQGFEGVLSDVRLATEPEVNSLAKIHMFGALQDDHAVLATYINNVGEADFQRLTGENPSKIFQNLKQLDHPQVNQVYVEHLFERKLIDEPTRARLISNLKYFDGGFINNERYLETLGTQEELTQELISKLKQEVSIRVRNPFGPPTENFNKQAVSLLTESYLETIDNHAKSLYLTKNAFEHPEAMKFDEAAKTYDSQQWQTLIDPNERQKLTAKAYVEAHYGLVPQEKVAYQSQLDKFFSETKISSSPPRKLFIGDKEFPPIDQRLAELQRKPLVKGDERLKETPWENMPVEDQAKLNEAAALIFPNLDRLRVPVRQNQVLRGKIGINEQHFQDDIPVILDVIKGIRQHAKPAPLPHEAFGEGALLATADKIIGKQSRLPSFVRGWIDQITKFTQKQFLQLKGIQIHPS
ncbi:hypothetical protein PTTG_04987, partial [Puccinia triticina 1-1 BBBD Race 1]